MTVILTSSHFKCRISEKTNPGPNIYMFHYTPPDDVQEAYNLIQDLMPTTPQVIYPKWQDFSFKNNN